MSISTPGDLCLQALKRSGAIGLGQTADAEMMNDAFDTLNGLISQWNRKRWLVWALDDVSCVSTGNETYGVGTGEDFDTRRIDRLEAAYVRLLPTSNGQTFDTPLMLINSREDYSLIVLKALQTWPSCIWYDSQFPVGFIRPYPVPPAGQYEIHIIVKNQITPFASLTEDIDTEVPPEYFEALSWNLCTRLIPTYGLSIRPDIVNLAKISLNVLRQANLQIPTLKMPFGYPRNGGYGYGWTLGITGGFA